MIEHADYIEHPDYWEIRIEDLVVTLCLVDFAFGFHLDQGRYSVKIEVPFVFSVAQESYNVTPETQDSVCPVLSIFNKAVSEARAYKRGELQISFLGGSSIVVAPNAAYEAWEIAGSNGLLMVCTPGGDISIWERNQSK